MGLFGSLVKGIAETDGFIFIQAVKGFHWLIKKTYKCINNMVYPNYAK